MNQEIEHRLAILRRRQVEQRTGLSRSTIYQYIKEGRGGRDKSDRSLSGVTALYCDDSRSKIDETTETESLSGVQGPRGIGSFEGDRKSTRLNSSHW